MKYWLSFVFIIISITACKRDNKTTYADISVNALSAALWSVEQTKNYLDTATNYLIFEISKKEKYRKKHLPNAYNLWRPDYENQSDYAYGGMMASPVQMEALLSKYGVKQNTQLIIYDTKGSVDAARFWWILKEYGHDKTIIMDGGITAWQKAGFVSETTESTRPKASDYRFAKPLTKTRLASIDMIKDAMSDENTIVLDTREPEEYVGQPYINKNKIYQFKKGAFTNGCIPKAVHLNWSDAVDLNGNHCIKSIKDLKYNFEQAGITPDKTIIAYCQSGVRSAHATFVLSEILAYPNVYNYDGSWIEWSYKHIKEGAVSIEQKTSAAEVNKIFAELQEELQIQVNDKSH